MSANFNEPLEVIQSGFTDTVKEGCPWVFMSHTLIDDVDNVIDTVSKAINENEENQVIIIKFEGAIAHFIVRTLALGMLSRFFRRISSSRKEAARRCEICGISGFRLGNRCQWKIHSSN
jgi:hypothetical protein